MSALPPKADMCSAVADVCYGPIADMRTHRRDGHLRRPVMRLGATIRARQSQEKTSANRQFGYSRRRIFQRSGRTFGDRPTKVLCLLTKGFQLRLHVLGLDTPEILKILNLG